MVRSTQVVFSHNLTQNMFASDDEGNEAFATNYNDRF